MVPQHETPRCNQGNKDRSAGFDQPFSAHRRRMVNILTLNHNEYSDIRKVPENRFLKLWYVIDCGPVCSKCGVFTRVPTRVLRQKFLRCDNVSRYYWSQREPSRHISISQIIQNKSKVNRKSIWKMANRRRKFGTTFSSFKSMPRDPSAVHIIDRISPIRTVPFTCRSLWDHIFFSIKDRWTSEKLKSITERIKCLLYCIMLRRNYARREPEIDHNWCRFFRTEFFSDISNLITWYDLQKIMELQTEKSHPKKPHGRSAFVGPLLSTCDIRKHSRLHEPRDWQNH